MLPLDVFGTSAGGENLTWRGKFCGMKSSFTNLLYLKQMFVRKVLRTVCPPLNFLLPLFLLLSDPPGDRSCAICRNTLLGGLDADQVKVNPKFGLSQSARSFGFPIGATPP